jgi:hypothetical protein
MPEAFLIDIFGAAGGWSTIIFFPCRKVSWKAVNAAAFALHHECQKPLSLFAFWAAGGLNTIGFHLVDRGPCQWRQRMENAV